MIIIYLLCNLLFDVKIIKFNYTNLNFIQGTRIEINSIYCSTNVLSPNNKFHLILAI